MAKNKGLGRGLDTIYADNMIEENDREITKLKLGMIQPRSDQPRTGFNQESLKELADSITVHGVLQPLLVRKGSGDFYEIIAGAAEALVQQLLGGQVGKAQLKGEMHGNLSGNISNHG